MIDAVVCKIVPENFHAIISECGVPKTFEGDKIAFLEEWVADNGDGYFLRHEGSPFDCNLFPSEIFDEVYSLGAPSADLNQLFIKCYLRGEVTP